MVEGDFPGPYDQWILFGDSLTQQSSNQDGGFGFHAALQDAYIRRLDIINRGFSGYTTANARAVLPKFYPSPEIANVKLMTIFFGANDACAEGMFQHVSLDKYTENLKAIAQSPQVKKQNPKILIITPPPVNEYQLEAFDASGGVPHPSRTAARTKAYADSARAVASEIGVPCVDLWTALMKAAGWVEGQPLVGSREVPNSPALASFFADGLHFTGSGYRIMYDTVMQSVKSNWPDLLPEALPMVFEHWQTAPST